MNRLMLSAVICLSISATEAFAQGESEAPDNPHFWKHRTTSVAVFKNGLGFFMREGEVALRDGWCVAREMPPATFGTLAIYSMNEKEMVDVIGAGPGEIVDFDDEDAAKDPAVKRARLEAVKGLSVQLTYEYKGQRRAAAGKLVSVGNEFVVLDTETNSFAVPFAEITRMQVLELPVRIHVASDEKPAQQTRLGMAYLRKGITWIPEYTLRVIDDKTAQLTLRGTLVNEAEDLIHTDVHFVVGVPNFVHTDYLSPVAVGQIIRTIGSALAPSQVQSQIMSRAAITSNVITADQFDRQPVVTERPAAGPGGDLASVMGSLPQMGGAAATDYTVYTRKDLTLRRGEKAIVTLFVKTIRYSHIYRWTPPELLRHMLVLQNDTDTAWTTGPCLAVSDRRPLTEDLLQYTPKGGKCELPVTTAVNIAHTYEEAEVDRKLKAHAIHSSLFLDLVTLEGTVKLRNFEKEKVIVVVTINVSGKPIEVSAGGSISVNPQKLVLTQREGTVKWHLELEPGQEKTLTYKYERFIQSG